MTRTGYAKPLTFHSSSRPSTRPSKSSFRFHPLSSFELQPASRFAARPYPLERGISFGFLPFSAAIIRRDRQVSTPTRIPSPGFHNLLTGKRPRRLAGLFHPAGTPRVRGLQSLTAYRSPESSLPVCSYTVTRLFMVSIRRTQVFHDPSRRSFPSRRSIRRLLALCRAGSILSFGRSWSCHSRYTALHTPNGFTRLTRLQLSWPSLLQGFPLRKPWTRLSLLGFRPL
jgi:hypothetical protein